MHGYYWNWGHGPFMMVFWIVIIFAAVSLIKVFFKRESRQESALDLLKKRYATNEISKEEFALMKNDISN
jgi:putative membrane protein